MGIRYSKRIKVGKNTHVNVSKSGIGVSSGTDNTKTGIGPRGTHYSSSIPGTGIRYQSYGSTSNSTRYSNADSGDFGPRGCWIAIVIIAAIIGVAGYFLYIRFMSWLN